MSELKMVPQWHKIGVGPPQLEVQLEVLLQVEVNFSPGTPPRECPLFGSVPYSAVYLNIRMNCNNTIIVVSRFNEDTEFLHLFSFKTPIICLILKLYLRHFVLFVCIQETIIYLIVRGI